MNSLFSRFAILASLLAFLSGPGLISARAEPPRVFNELAEGVNFAREGKRLILFLLVENFGEISDAIVKAVSDELDLRGNEFTIVRCRYESADHRQLFKERFKQDPAQMPLGVIASPEGEVIVGTNGTAPEAYRLMIHAARVQGGLEKDPEKIAAITAEIEAGDEAITNTIFGIKRSDIAPEKVLLTTYRDWTFQNGTTVRAALLEAKGASGIFIQPDGKQVELPFNNLGDADKAFLTRLLTK